MSNETNVTVALPDVGVLLRATVTLYREHVSLFLGISAWLLVPLLVTVGATFAPPSFAFALALVANALSVAIAVWILGATTLVTAYTSLKNEHRMDVERIGKATWRLAPALFLLSFVQIFGTLVGFFAFIVPGVLFLVWTWFAAQCFMLERNTIVSAFKKSRELVRGRFALVFERALLGEIAILLVYLVLSLGVISLVLSFSGAPTAEAFVIAPPLWAIAIDAVAQIVVLPLFVIYRTILYIELEKRTSLCASPPSSDSKPTSS